MLPELKQFGKNNPQCIKCIWKHEELTFHGSIIRYFLYNIHMFIICSYLNASVLTKLPSIKPYICVEKDKIQKCKYQKNISLLSVFSLKDITRRLTKKCFVGAWLVHKSLATKLSIVGFEGSPGNYIETVFSSNKWSESLPVNKFFEFPKLLHVDQILFYKIAPQRERSWSYWEVFLAVVLKVWSTRQDASTPDLQNQKLGMMRGNG